MEQAPARPRQSSLLDWARLTRFPNVFTAIADVSMGYLVVETGAVRVPLWAGVAVVTALVYCGGMVLNDVFDFQLDSKERPERVLPSGRIARSTAALVGGLMLAVGLGLAWLMWSRHDNAVPIRFQLGPIATVLVACVLLYDGILKPTPVGPVFMGACRFFNILMGMSLAREAGVVEAPATLMIPAAIGLYVIGVTWFARYEAIASPRPFLFSGLMLMLLGTVVLTLVPLQGGFPHQAVGFDNPWVWPLLICLVTAPVWRRAIQAFISTRPADVQGTIRQSLMTLIVIDAAIVLVVAGPPAAIGILLLVVPATLLARVVNMT